MKYQVMLVDDHRLFRKGMRFMVDSLDGFETAGEAANGLEFLGLLNQCSPDIVLLDIDMPEMDGVEAARRALQKCPGLKIIVISMFGDPAHYHKVVDAGVRGFLLKNSDLAEVKLALETVVEGGTYFSQELLMNLVQALKDAPGKAAASTPSRDRALPSPQFADSPRGVFTRAGTPGDLWSARQVFISHSAVDVAAVEDICRLIERQEITCWLAPRDIPPTSTYAREIVKAIRSCYAMVLVLSANANNSEHVKNEVESAVKYKKPIFVFRIENVEPSDDIELFITRSHRIDAFTPRFEMEIRRFAEHVQALIEERRKNSAPAETRLGGSAATPPGEVG